MAFGPIMRMTTKEGLAIELAPFTRDDATEAFSKGLQQDSVIRYISLHHKAQLPETVGKWYDKIIDDSEQIIWGIWAVEGGERRLIGNSAIMNLEREPLYQGVSGIVISDKAYWGRGVASVAHKARTWYVFRQMGLVRIKSAVIEENEASRRALERMGYTHVYTERNDTFVDGTLRHKDCLECLNPDDWAWRLWWGDDRPPVKSVDARRRTREVLEWTEENVELL